MKTIFFVKFIFEQTINSMSGWDKERGKVTDVCDFWKGFRKFSDVRFVSWHLWIRMGEHSQENRNRDLRTMTFVFWIFRKKKQIEIASGFSMAASIVLLWLVEDYFSEFLKYKTTWNKNCTIETERKSCCEIFPV